MLDKLNELIAGRVVLAVDVVIVAFCVMLAPAVIPEIRTDPIFFVLTLAVMPRPIEASCVIVNEVIPAYAVEVSVTPLTTEMPVKGEPPRIIGPIVPIPPLAVEEVETRILVTRPRFITVSPLIWAIVGETNIEPPMVMVPQLLDALLK